MIRASGEARFPMKKVHATGLDAEVTVLQLRVGCQLGRAAALHHAPFLQHVMAIGYLAQRSYVLVDDKDGQAFRFQLRDRAVDLRADERCEALRSEEHTSELQSPDHLVCRLLLEKKKKNNHIER